MERHRLRRLRAIDLACVVLLIVGVVRLLAVVLHAPLLGYANQYDMARTSACVDLWPALPPPARYAAHQSAPLERYVAEHVDGGPCYPSSVVAFVEVAKAAVGAMRIAGLARSADFPLRAVGVAEALALAVLALAFVAAERGRPRARLAHAALFALVLSDPALAMWMNTLYTEFATVFFAYAVGGMLAFTPRDRSAQEPVGTRDPPGRAFAAAPARATLAVAALAGLAWSRQQYAAFAIIPVLVAAPGWWQRARGAWLAAVAVLVASLALQAGFLARLPAIRDANLHDFYLGAALPAAHDEARALRELGLPASCREAVGANWYVGMGADPQRQCPQVGAFGRLDFLRLVTADPALPWRILARGLPLVQSWWQHHLGMVAGVRFGDWSRARGPFAWSLASLVERVPLAGYLTLIAALAATFVVAAVAWAREALRGDRADGWVRALLFASAVGIYAPLSAIFGDGYVEVSRHALLVHPAMAALGVLGVGRLAMGAGSGVAAVALRRRRAVGAWLAVTSCLAVALVWGVGHASLGQGVVDLPASRHLDGDAYAMRGWAADPWGVRAVRVAAYRNLETATPDRVWVAAYGRVVHGPEGESLGAYYPTYPGADHGGFALDIRRDAWPPAAPCLRTWVENRRGVATEIDRRCVTR